MQRDYYIEYFEFVDLLFREYIDEIKHQHPEAFKIGDYSCEIPVICFLLFKKYFTSVKELYNQLRKEGKNKEEVHRIFKKELDKSINENLTQPPVLQSKVSEDICTLLYPYRYQVLIYILNKRQLNYLTPLIQQINQPVLLVTEYELPDETDLPDYVTAIKISFLKEVHYSPFLYNNFPQVFHYLNTFDQLLNVLQPCCTILLEGCHYQQEIITIISKKLSIPSICIQQGWPSLLLSCFRNMQYEYFFTWGNQFSYLWKMQNPIPNFIPVGYMYHILPLRQKNHITFFLQGPYGINDILYIKTLLDFLLQSAVLFPTQAFCVREHPEYRIPDEYRERYNGLNNIKDVSNDSLDEIYAETILVVSHFSSCLMEGIAHGCIPFVFDLTYGSRYSPDIEKMELGIIASTIKDAITKMKIFLSNSIQKEHFLRKSNEIKNDLFASYEDDTIRKMVEYIKNIITFGHY